MAPPGKKNLIRNAVQTFEKSLKFDFDEWFTEYRKNYRLAGENNNDESTPKYEFITENKELKSRTYQLCKYWPNRSITTEYVLFYATPIQLCQIIQDYDRQRLNQGRSSWHYTASKKGIMVKLYFSERRDPKIPNPDPIVCAEFSFRLYKIEKSSQLTTGEIESLAKRIFDEFKDYKFKKGKITVSYKHPDTGINSWGHFFNKSEGINFYKKLAQVAGVDYKGCKITEGETEDNSVSSQIILGQTYKKRKMPIAEVYFGSAWLEVPELPNPIQLIIDGRIVYP